MKLTQAKNDEITFFSQFSDYDVLPEQYYEAVFDTQKISGANKKQIVLEIGCGSGAWGIRLAKKGYSVVGIELSPILAKHAKNSAKKMNADFSVIICDAERLPIRFESVEICYCGYVLHHFKTLSALFSELNTALKPNGKLYAVEPNGSSPIIALQRKLMTMLPQKWVMAKGIATSNERVHPIKKYLKSFSNVFSDTYYCFIKPYSEETHLSIKLNLIDLLLAARVAIITFLPKHKVFRVVEEANLLIFASKK